MGNWGWGMEDGGGGWRTDWGWGMGVMGGLGHSTCLELGSICEEVGLPHGVMNVITGLGQHAGAPLSSHPDVDKVRTPPRNLHI